MHKPSPQLCMVKQPAGHYRMHPYEGCRTLWLFLLQVLSCVQTETEDFLTDPECCCLISNKHCVIDSLPHVMQTAYLCIVVFAHQSQLTQQRHMLVLGPPCVVALWAVPCMTLCASAHGVIAIHIVHSLKALHTTICPMGRCNMHCCMTLCTSHVNNYISGTLKTWSQWTSQENTGG